MASTAQSITQSAMGAPPAYGSVSVPPGSGLYPSLGDYMGLELSPHTIEQQMPVVVANPPAVRKHLSFNYIFHGH